MKIVIEIPDEAVEMLKDMAVALQTIARTVTVVTESPEQKPGQKPAKPEQKPDPQPKVSLEAVRAKLADLSRNGKRRQVKELIQSFGVKKLTEIPKDKLGELMEKVREIA
ncbi:hypothetical protein [Thermoactinomyces sp. CICC 23799]|uniref:hypothetical protein n=1 Tax=Thermoactinomyces sp. CICC 23799 TaxID=2767429 RepID=UPI0018DBBDF3|nr:hypothetical protein [Thermoactinomyces sp. CICC 23799]MBH8600499.1 hypothetical protein [Thermoactinomyces sp. CICC 23799]